MTYGKLLEKSLGILGFLQAQGIKPDDEMIFQIDDNRSFIFTFWACILGRIIPVPVTVGNNEELSLKVLKIWKVLKNPYLVTTEKILNLLEDHANANNLDETIDEIKPRTILLTEIRDINVIGELVSSKPNDVAFIQFSSGSTGDPKGVVLTHKNLLTNITSIIYGSALNKNDSSISWMPLTHDMGLIGCHLVPLAFDINQYNIPTSLFIRRPTLWIEKANEHKTTLIQSPNFGHKYFMDFLKPEIAKGWDLSHIRLIFNGAEPISPELCERFMNFMGEYGLKRESMFPVYGLAEASLAVCFPPVNEELVTINLDRQFLSIGDEIKQLNEKTDPNSVLFVDEGYPVNRCQVRICNENNKQLAESVIGYIQIKGDNVTRGYYNNDEATNNVITDDGWLNTGDLGFLKDARLIVTGRAKDIIFINGQNYYPHDIERVAERVEGIELGKVIACGVYNEKLQREELIIFVLFKKQIEKFIHLLQ